jgi:hypothetical protein
MCPALLEWMEDHAGHYRGNLRSAVVPFVSKAVHGPRTPSRAHYGFVEIASPSAPEKGHNMALAEYLLDESLLPFLHKVEDVRGSSYLHTYQLFD